MKLMNMQFHYKLNALPVACSNSCINILLQVATSGAS